VSEIERAAMPDHAELIREIAKLLASRVEAAMQHTFRLELADAASGKPFDPEQRRKHLMILFAEIIKGMGSDRFAETPVELLDQFAVMSVIKNHDTGGLLRSLVNSFLIAYSTPETADRAYLALTQLEALRVEVGEVRKAVSANVVMH
jgi:hypothetical protein